MNNKWTLLFLAIGLLIYGLSPGPNNLMLNFTPWELREQTMFLSGTVAASFMVLAVLTSLRLSWLNKQMGGLDKAYKIHKSAAIYCLLLCLLFIYHSATVQFKERWLATPGGYLLLGLMAVGAVASIFSLLQLTGFNRKFPARIRAITRHGDVLALSLSTAKAFKYRPGQYSFLRFAHDNEPHPFTMASSGMDAHNHTFAIKNFGDFTGRLPQEIALKQPVMLEGPYGEFQFDDDKLHHIWVATGIGITPFMTKMEQLAARPALAKRVMLIYCARGPLEQQFPADLRQRCLLSGVQLKYVNTVNDELITRDNFTDLVGEMDDASVWFCGHSGLLEAVGQSLRAADFDMNHLHLDSFQMR